MIQAEVGRNGQDLTAKQKAAIPHLIAAADYAKGC